MMNIYDQVKSLNESGLYDDLKTVCSLVLTMSENNLEFLSVCQKYQITVFYGNALYQNEEYKKSESVYRKALHLKKLINKTKGKSPHGELVSEVDVKYRIHLCHNQLKQYREAIGVLEGINSKQRTARINMALGQLYQRTGMDRSAITCFKEVLRECPLSLEAAQGLLVLGVKGTEVTSLMMAGLSGVANLDWLSSWIKAHSFAASREYNNAISTFKNLDTKACLRDSVNILCSLGESYVLNGDYNAAIMVLQRARSIDPLLLKNMDILAFVLAKEKKVKDLENLSSHLVTITENAPEPWIALGYYSMITKKGTRAVYFAQKAFTLDNRSVQALLLKGVGLLELKRITEAIMHFREALRLAPHRYEAHKGLVDSYIANHRNREAITLAGNAVKHLGTTARSLTLYASVLAKEQMSIDKAKNCLEKAMRIDPFNLDAVYVMADILSSQQQFEAGITLLRNTLRSQSTHKLHQLLGDFLTHTNEHQEALDQYSIALSLDHTNTRARDGMERVQKHNDMGIESPYEMELEEISDNEAALDGSDMESGWSDTDL
ncbi:anaphase-promoting complex subunit 7-like [Lineus longissimus]|uniref:anaphase-promoting complex subunit 7-like n=1 Tax=Lineus longissimus TaxID=88925 RepID=UPI002B4D406A